ncbi:putative disease resistance protein RGA3 [Miscanthus floridulus]|uniref:putative disease resistance protein RGA3 n=1 Tax=Miscanthus floridulus TaxID=154761 RepID=UPI00345A575D
MAEETKTESVDEMLQTLQLLLLRVHVILEAADGRSITSQAMLQQLNILRKEMYRGYYVLDCFRGNQASQDDAKGQNSNYPPRCRQPYFMHLMIGLSMFGRQMEMERVINFVMQTEPCTGESTGVLPIIGPEAVGKSTLVAHVYNSEKVRDYFSRIVLVTHEDVKEGRLATLKDGGLTIYQNNPLHNGKGWVLVIIELLEDVVEEDTWKRWYLASAACLESGSKIVITSRSSKIIKFGTTQALLLTALPIETYWYFFKVLTFGSANPEDQPKME